MTTTIKNLASRGDFRTWNGYACSGTGHGYDVRADIGEALVTITIGERLYDCDRPNDINIGAIRGIMLAAVAAHARCA